MISLTSNQKPISNFLISLFSSSNLIKVSHFSTCLSSSKKFEEDSRNVSVSVWWDIENCGVPIGVNPFKISLLIREAVRVNGIKGPLQISAFGDVFCISRPNQEALSSTGINLIHVPNGGKNSADRSLLIDLMYWVSQNPPPAHIFLISSDRDFSGILHRLRMNNYNILLAAREGNASSVLCSAASIMWLWNDLAKGENLAGRHFNQPPDGPYNSWYGHYRGPLENPFDMPELANSSRDRNDSTANDVSSVQPIPEAVKKQIRQIVESYPYGVSITELRAQMARTNVTLDKNFYGHKKFSRFLLSVPEIVKVVSNTDGQLFLRPVSPKVPEPIESDCHSVGPTTGNGSPDVLLTRKVKGDNHSVIRTVDVEPKLLLSTNDVKKEETLGTKVEKIPEKNTLDAPREHQVASTKEHYANETIDSQVLENHVTLNDEQNPKSEIGLFKRLWSKWFNGSIEVKNTVPEIPDKFHTDTAIRDKSNYEEGPTVSIRQHEICGTSCSSVVYNQRISKGESDVGKGFVSRVLNWFEPSKNQTPVSTPSKQSTEGASSIENARKYEVSSQESKHEDLQHSRNHELFSKDTFWHAFESFLKSHRGSDIVLKSTSRDHFAMRLKNHGPLVLRSLQEIELLHLIHLLVSEKKWIEDFPSKTPRFTISLSPNKSSTSVQTLDSNGLSSLFMSSSSENLESKFSSFKPKKPSDQSRSEMLSDCQKLLDELLQQYPEGLNMGWFKKMFFEKYKYNLDYQKLGYPKLVSLLQIMPGVKIQSSRIFHDNVVYAPGIESLGSDGGMTNLLIKEDQWDELGPVENSNYSTVDSDDDEFSEEEEGETSTLTNAKEQNRSRVKEEDNLLMEILDSWCGNDTKDEGGLRGQDHGSNAEGLVNCSKEENWSCRSNRVGFKGKMKASKSYTFVADSMEGNKHKLIDGILDNIKKSGESRMQS